MSIPFRGPGTPESAATPHDQLLKTLLRAFFLEFVELVDPEVARSLDPESVESLDKEVFTDLPRGKRREMDLVFRVRPWRGPPEILLVHIEVERAFSASHAARMARYYFQLKLRYPEPPILPIVLFLKGGPAGVERHTWCDSLGSKTICRFDYLAMGLSTRLAEEFLQESNPLAWSLAALMRPGNQSRPSLKLACLKRIVTAKLDEARRFLLANLVETYLQLTPEEQERYRRLLGRDSCQAEVETMEQIWSEKMIAKGRQEGIAKGRQEGRREGALAVLLSQIEHRFGEIPSTARQRLETRATNGSLDDLARRLVDARSLEDLDLGS